jgi:hypothetical protein
MNFLKERRLTQLEKESLIDSKLIEYYPECPNLVFEYLIKFREINRSHAKNLYNSSIFNSLDKYKIGMDVIDDIQTIDLDNVCTKLPDILEKYKNYNQRYNTQ